MKMMMIMMTTVIMITIIIDGEDVEKQNDDDTMIIRIYSDEGCNDKLMTSYLCYKTVVKEQRSSLKYEGYSFSKLIVWVGNNVDLLHTKCRL